MLKILFHVLMLFQPIQPADAQNAALNFLGVQTSATVATAASSPLPTTAFQNPLPQQTGRQSCIIQYRPVITQSPGQTPTALGFVFFGPAAPTTTLTSFVMFPYQIITCDTVNGEVEGSAVWIASQNTGDTFIIKVK